MSVAHSVLFTVYVDTYRLQSVSKAHLIELNKEEDVISEIFIGCDLNFKQEGTSNELYFLQSIFVRVK